ncbi:hypothetical protein SR39_31635 [Methylobacterium radiotolerans]|nr:hypothetical protein SR39_31635 [Methylobacterium radiotolerans]
MTGKTSVGHHPLGHAWQTVQQRDSVWQFVGLTGSQDEGDRATETVGDHAGLAAKAAARAAQRLAPVPLSL